MPETLHEAPAPAPPRGTAGDHVGFRLVVFATLLVVTLLAGYGLGWITGRPTAADPARSAPGMTAHEIPPHAHTAAPAAAAGAGGLAISADGLTLVPESTTFPAQRFAFRITAGGIPVTTYAVVHDKPLHLVVIRRDLSGFQHLHPTMAPDGTWSTDLTLPAAGSYRAIADFTAILGGRPVATTLGADLTVTGSYVPVVLPTPARRATTDGFSVSYDGTPRTGSTQPIVVNVTGAGGRPAVLQPYLGAFGHLVVLRQGDLGYVHVHPEPQLADGGVRFWLAAPSAGSYRMFFDFRVGGRVHTAAWTVTVN
ncbi:MAG TPA: hypothetical protein VH502_06010 [Actinoplanes sp.]